MVISAISVLTSWNVVVTKRQPAGVLEHSDRSIGENMQAQYNLFQTESKPAGKYRIPAYRVQLVKEGSLTTTRALVECSQDALDILNSLPELQAPDREHFAVLFLDTKHRVIWADVPFHGSINTASVFPRAIVKAALLCNASAIIVAHNHPSGNPEPSVEDRRVTEQLQQACKLLDITVLDHLVLGETHHFSFADKRML